MTFMAAVVIWGSAAIGGMLLGGLLAHLKNRDYSVWMGWGFMFPPIVLYYLIAPRLAGPRPRQPTLDELDRHDR